MPATWKKLAYADEVPALTLFAAAHTMLASNEANVAVGVVLAANEFIGRLSTANIANLTAANVRTIINVEDGADVTDAAGVAAAGAVMETDFANVGDLPYASAANTVSMLGIGTEGQVLKVGAANAPEWGTDEGAVAFPETANATTRGALTPALGEGCFQVDTLECYVCTVIA
jgi:hypothetical protein